MLEVLLNTAAAERIGARLFDSQETLHAPHLVDLEVAQVLRRYSLSGELDLERGREAICDLSEFPLLRYPHEPLLERIWELRGHVTAYDAAYIALAEALDAPLLTRDRKLAATRGHAAAIELV